MFSHTCGGFLKKHFYFPLFVLFVCFIWNENNSPSKRGVGLAAGSNALASQLYSKNVNNASSRNSNGGDNEDFCSDASLEDDVVDLGHKVKSTFDWFILII